MYDMWIGNVNLAPILLLFTFVVVLPVQFVLCIRFKSKILRLLPVIILSIMTMSAIVAAAVCTGWDVVFFIVSAIYLAIMLFVCGLVWGIWGILCFVKKKKSN